jgi:hypothetical protein
MAERGRVFSASYKKGRSADKRLATFAPAPSRFSSVFSGLPGSRAAELLRGIANTLEKAAGQQA